MVWFDPPATVDEFTAWISPGLPGGKHKIGRWPHPNTPRTQSKFIIETDRDLAHTAYRRLFSWEFKDTTDATNFPNFQEWGEWDLEIIAESHIAASSDINSEGWQAFIDIEYDPDLPVAGVEGVLLTLRAEHSASGHFIEKQFEHEGDSDAWFFDKDVGSDFLGWDTELKSAGFPYDLVIAFDYAMSDCFLFPRDFVPEAGFARFDGIESYIKNRSRTNDTTNSWRQEFDIRLHTTGFIHYLCKSFNTTRFCVIRDDRIQYINRVVTFSTSLNQDQWYHIDFRWQWITADGLYRVSVDGGPDDSASNTNFNARWDQFGKRAGQAPVGEFDLRNFKLTNGPSSSPIVYLDQKFDTNACDDGPDGRHGDTFFMSLPSCP